MTSDIRVTTTAEWEEYKEKPANWTFNVPEIRNRTELARVLDVTNERDFNDQPNKKVELSIPTLSRFPISFYIGREQIAELKPGDDKKDKYGQLIKKAHYYLLTTHCASQKNPTCPI